jgi:tripartite-type tricarboxylate transporter receptor subunit TctC
MIVANTPGGGADTIARIVADVLTAGLGQQVVVENRGGAGGRIGMEAAARSAPDGYTLVLGTGSNLATVPALYSKLGYRPLKDFAPISLAATTSYMLVAHPSVPANTARELVNLRQTRAGGLNYASTGPGTFSHLGGELMKSLAGLKATHIAYKGSAAATLSLVQGETDVMFSNFIASLSLVRAKRLRTLGVTSLKRSAVVPDVPTIDESGIRGFQMQQSYSLWAPAGTSVEIIGRLNEEVTRRLPAVDAQKTLAADGTELTVSSPKALEKLIIDETAKWSAVVEKAGIRVEQ